MKKNQIKVELTAAQVDALFLALRIAKSDYEDDCDHGVPSARRFTIRACEIENKLVKALKTSRPAK